MEHMLSSSGGPPSVAVRMIMAIVNPIRMTSMIRMVIIEYFRNLLVSGMAVIFKITIGRNKSF